MHYYHWMNDRLRMNTRSKMDSWIHGWMDSCTQEWRWMSRRRKEWMIISGVASLQPGGTVDKTYGPWGENGGMGWSAPCTTAIRSLVCRRLNKRHSASWKITTVSSWKSFFSFFRRSIKGSIQSLIQATIHQSKQPSIRSIIQSLIHPFTLYLFIHSFIHPFTFYPSIHSFIHQFLFIYLSICPSIHTSIHASINYFIHLFINSFIHCPYIHSFYSSIHPSFHTFIHSFIHSSIHPFTRLSIHASIHSSIHPSFHTFIH